MSPPRFSRYLPAIPQAAEHILTHGHLQTPSEFPWCVPQASSREEQVHSALAFPGLLLYPGAGWLSKMAPDKKRTTLAHRCFKSIGPLLHRALLPRFSSFSLLTRVHFWYFLPSIPFCPFKYREGWQIARETAPAHQPWLNHQACSLKDGPRGPHHRQGHLMGPP